MTRPEAVERGRRSFDEGSWTGAYEELSSAGPLGPEDLDRLGTAAYLLGKDDECVEIWSRAHQAFVDEGNAHRAARVAFWLGLTLILKGQMAPGGGWLARAGSLLEDLGECAERGFVLVPAGMQALFGGEPESALETFARAAEIGRRCEEPDLVALARFGYGNALIDLGRAAEGTGVLDEVMVSVTAGEVSPIVAGLVYCGVIDACHQMLDLRRAREWTDALSRWCASQPDLVPYRGQCLVHRAQIMQLQGEWPDALDEARRAYERFSDPPGQPAVGMALYQLAEIHRLRGEFDEAEDAYRRASRWGRSPHPGLALLRLSQGRLDDAVSAIRRVLDEAVEPLARARLLPAYVEIMLEAGDLEPAGRGAQELSRTAEETGVPVLRALAEQAQAAVDLAAGEARSAIARLRRASEAWTVLEAPYESARVRVLVAAACRALGDDDTGRLELDAARATFERLGARPDLERVGDLADRREERAAGLSARELEVLRHVAAGKTNRAIASDLVISEKTVARHLSNIFTKLGLSSRAAATAYAYENGLV